MKLLIATPAYGGQLTTQYFSCALDSATHLSMENVDFEFLTLANESLIPRARNRCATYALENKFDKLLFIDADMIWNWDMLKSIVFSTRDIISGTYPIKDFPISLNFNPLPEQREIFGSNRGVKEFIEFKNKYANADGEIEVYHAPTGFMCINTYVFKKLKESGLATEYLNYDAPSKTRKVQYEFFPTGVTSTGEYLSEDWAFCEMARHSGFGVYLQSNAITAHTGTFHYKAGQVLQTEIINFKQL